MSEYDRNFDQDSQGYSPPASDERFPIFISPGVTDLIPDFNIDEEKLASFATDPKGPIGLGPKDLEKVAINFDTTHNTRFVLSGITLGYKDPSLEESNTNSGVNSITISIAVRSMTSVVDPVELERTLIHELRHAKQFIYDERSVKFGRYAILSSKLVFAALGVALVPEVIGIHNKLDVAIAAFSGCTGSLVGYRIGDIIAPHEREARQSARVSDYMGIVNGGHLS